MRPSLRLRRSADDQVTVGTATLSGRPRTLTGLAPILLDVIRAARTHTREVIDTLVLVVRIGKPGQAAMITNSLGRCRERMLHYYNLASR
jgi:hypothetical protein